tara:strand:+ start:289 stop:621 length:333 start_codon:yes stop_codon:yes gene_type:complete
MSKWKKIYWNDFKRFVWNYGLMIIVVVGSIGLIQYSKVLANAKNEYIQELEQYNKQLEVEVDDLLETTEAYEEAYDALEEEVALFGSMFAELENEPGGHEMLKKLYDQYK